MFHDNLRAMSRDPLPDRSDAHVFDCLVQARVSCKSRAKWVEERDRTLARAWDLVQYVPGRLRHAK